MNRKWLVMAVGAAAAALGYGATRVYESKKTTGELKKTDPQKAVDPVPDGRIETISCPTCERPVRDYELICPYCGQDMRTREHVEQPPEEG